MQDEENVNPNSERSRAAAASGTKLPPLSAVPAAPAVPPPIPLSFVQFQALRREERSGNSKIGGRRTRAAATRSSLGSHASLTNNSNRGEKGSKKKSCAGSQTRKGAQHHQQYNASSQHPAMSFDEFKTIKRLWMNNSDASAANDMSVVQKQKKKTRKKVSLGKGLGRILFKKTTLESTQKKKQLPARATAIAPKTSTTSVASLGNTSQSTVVITTSQFVPKSLKSRTSSDFPKLTKNNTVVKEFAVAGTVAEIAVSNNNEKEVVAKKINHFRKEKVSVSTATGQQMNLSPMPEGTRDSTKTAARDVCSLANDGKDIGDDAILGSQEKYFVTTHAIPVALSTLTEEDAVAMAGVPRSYESNCHLHPMDTSTGDGIKFSLLKLPPMTPSPVEYTPDKLIVVNSLRNNESPKWKNDKMRKQPIVATVNDEAQKLLDATATSSTTETEEVRVSPCCKGLIASTILKLPDLGYDTSSSNCCFLSAKGNKEGESSPDKTSMQSNCSNNNNAIHSEGGDSASGCNTSAKVPITEIQNAGDGGFGDGISVVKERKPTPSDGKITSPSISGSQRLPLNAFTCPTSQNISPKKIISLPTPASKTRRKNSKGGLVKNRINIIERQSAKASSSSSGGNSFRQTNILYTQQRQRQRLSTGSASSISSLSSAHYIRSIPIGVPKTYNRGSNEDNSVG